MDMSTGRLYESVEAAREAGATEVAEIRASRDQAERISAALMALIEKENDSE